MSPPLVPEMTHEIQLPLIPFQPTLRRLAEILDHGAQGGPSSLAQQERPNTADSQHCKWHIPSAHRPLLDPPLPWTTTRNLPSWIGLFNIWMTHSARKYMSSLVLGIGTMA